METVERLLREEFTDPESTILLDRVTMLARVQRSRHRRTARTAVGALVLAVAGGAAFGAQAQFAGQPNPSPNPEPGGVITHVEAIGFANRNSGYALVNTCLLDTPVAPSAPSAETRECRFRFIATNDGGRTWRDRTVPPGLDRPDTSVAMFDGSRLVPVLSVLGDQALALRAGTGDEHWVSSDGGLNWQQGNATPQAAVATAPPEAQLVLRPPSQQRASTARTQLAVVNRDGTIAYLDSSPTDVEITIGDSPHINPFVAATDGTRWLTCYMKTTKQGCVVVSRDAGRTWQTIQPPPMPAETGLSNLSTIDGRTVVVIARSGNPDAGSEIIQSLRTTDGGTTWTSSALPQLAPMTEKGLVHGLCGEAIQANGDVIIAVDGTLYRVPADGSAYQQIPRAPQGIITLARSGPWLVATSFDGRSTRPVHDRAFIHISLDGVTWTDVHLP